MPSDTAPVGCKAANAAHAPDVGTCRLGAGKPSLVENTIVDNQGEADGDVRNAMLSVDTTSPKSVMDEVGMERLKAEVKREAFSTACRRSPTSLQPSPSTSCGR